MSDHLPPIERMGEVSCPYCGDVLYRESADVGVGVIYGPYGCPTCAYSEYEQYDNRDGKSPKNLENPEWYTDQFGGAIRKSAMKEKMEFFGLNPEIIDDVFGPAEL